VGIVIVGVLVGWLSTRKTQSPNQVLTPQSVPANVASSERVPSFSTNSRARLSQDARHSTSQTMAASTNLLTDWEDKLDEILGSDAEENLKAKQLLAIFPRLPEDGQVEVAQHLSNLVADQDYAPLGKFLKDSKEPEAVLDVLMVDVLNRPNSLKLPVLLEIARDQQHPKASEAKDLLELYLEDDYGTDWNKWQSKLDQWIKDNPD